MAVTFGTPVVNLVSAAARTSFTLSLTGVTSGQPIFVFFYDNGSTVDLTSITDTFPTPYRWFKVGHAANAIGASLYIGTEGAGTAGVITVTSPNERTGGVAIPCVGASSGSGFVALDLSGATTSTGTNTAPTGPTLDPSLAGEGAIYVVGDTNAITSSPAGFTITQLTSAGTYVAGVATLASPASGTPLSPAWATTASHTWACVGGIIRPAGSPSPGRGILAVL